MNAPHDTPRTNERAGYEAGYQDGICHGREDADHDLFDRLAAAVARAEAAEAKVAAVEALADEWDEDARQAWRDADRLAAGDVIADQITRRSERLRMTLTDVPTSAPTGEAPC